MGTPTDPKPVRFFVSLIYREIGQMSGIENKLVSLLGEISSRTDPALFLHTTYYEREMGSGLIRYFLLFKPLRDREELPSVKLMTNQLEEDTSEDGKRTINIDPGYITLEQVILATTKGYTHRIYLSKGIFADLTLTYSNGAFGPLPWTYPDYGSAEMMSLINRWREEYKADLRGGFCMENRLELNKEKSVAMPKSMTGFAKVETDCSDGKLYGEARALNNRYLEINIKLPKIDYTSEQKLRDLVKTHIKRGKVDITIKWDKPFNNAGIPKVNETAVKQYIALIETLKQDYGLKGDLTVDNILAFKDIIAYEENNSLTEDLLFIPFENLLKRLDEERSKEGAMINDDLLKRLVEIASNIQEIEVRHPLTAKAHEEKLREKMLEVTQCSSIDEVRVLQELVIYMERLDITEEIVRLKGHLANFRETLSSSDSMGRKLDFIIQEMVRETNTIGSKSNDLSINERVIKIKVEIEKIREQVQNVE